MCVYATVRVYVYKYACVCVITPFFAGSGGKVLQLVCSQIRQTWPSEPLEYASVAPTEIHGHSRTVL